MAQRTSPPRGLIPLGGKPRARDYLRALWARRQFAVNLATGQLRGEHMDTVLGSLWKLINPILLIGIYYFIFGVLLDAGTANVDPAEDVRPPNYIAFLTVGVMIYGYMQRTISGGASSIVNNVGLLRSLQFPRAILPLSVAIKEAIGFWPSLLVILATMVLTGEGLYLGMLVFPVVFVLMTLFDIGGAMVTARLTDTVRDMRNLLPFVFRLGFYLSGVLYDITRFTDNAPDWRWLEPVFLLNPFYVFISLSREYLMHSHGHFDLTWLWVSALAWTSVALVGGFFFFTSAEKRYGRG
ncbi:ABC transporter permease [Egicoccus halophilus]|uniref:Transport permease protein n=1 Tax=Egicoccus halophilus TaxID=1670830 RepID=A0A8J3ADG0_9ACTN|nr:ABC transporter permease [Egicoccus halophilus]GGI05973.1 transport permease protein [Egicoccus halophilus]